MRSSTRVRNSPPNPQASNSSSSSLSSARPERSTRSHRPKSASPGSLSDDEAPSGHHGDEVPLTRRSTRQIADDDDEAGQGDEELDGEAGETEDDVTRCVCGHQEYPGPPLTDDSTMPSDPLAEDAGGLFIQCDKCHVWQHGGCVGIMDESKSPENYFCESCDKRLHNVMTDSRGQRYSHYLPLYPNEPRSARKGSIANNEAKGKRERERDNISRASVDSNANKRRSTMNSRNAYDEEETLRRVIEESRGENEGSVSIASLRKGKRSRDDSEDIKHEIKRQRTSSDSPDPPSTLHTASHLADSDDDGSTTRTSASSLKKARSAAAENQRQREHSEREKVREQQRAEAAGRRKERAGRRRGDESEAIEDTPRPDATPALPTSQPTSPPKSAIPHAPASSHKKGAKKTQKRLGKNQWTKGIDSPHRSKSQPHTQPSSGEEAQLTAAADSNSATNSKNSPGSIQDAKTKLTKPKGKKQHAADGDTSKEREKDGMTLSDMKKRAAMMIEYISKAQVDLAAERIPTNSIAVQGGPVQPAGSLTNPDHFKAMNSREMMDVLTRQIMSWQQEYGEIAPAV